VIWQHEGGLLRDVLASTGPEQRQQEDLEWFGDGDLYEKVNDGGHGPVDGAGKVERQTEDESTDQERQPDNRRQPDHRHEKSTYSHTSTTLPTL